MSASELNLRRRVIELYLKVIFIGRGWGYKRPITGRGSQTHGWSRLLVVLMLAVVCVFRYATHRQGVFEYTETKFCLGSC